MSRLRNQNLPVARLACQQKDGDGGACRKAKQIGRHDDTAALEAIANRTARQKQYGHRNCLHCQGNSDLTGRPAHSVDRKRQHGEDHAISGCGEKLC